MTLDLNLVIAILGMILVLSAFVLDEFGNVNKSTTTYNIINIFGAGFLAYYAFTLSSFPFLILNVVWMLVAIYKLVNILRKMKSSNVGERVHSESDTNL